MTLEIHTILCRAGTMDNYSYLLIDKDTNQSAIIDASEAKPIYNKCAKLGITPNYIFSTHHHFDHTDANKELKELFNAKVVGAEDRIPEIDIKVKAGDKFNLGNSVAEIIDVSAHTQNHILWYFKEDKALFTGDTLFNLCVGGLFEGSAEQMFEALKKIKALPDDVMFYPGHEYTIHGVDFAMNINLSQELIDYVKYAENRLKANLPVHPTALGIEKKVNPYLKAASLEELQDIV